MMMLINVREDNHQDDGGAAAPVDGGESSEAGHVGLGPVQGVEPMSAPHQHPVRDHHQDYQSSNLQDLSASFSPSFDQ